MASFLSYPSYHKRECVCVHNNIKMRRVNNEQLFTKLTMQLNLMPNSLRMISGRCSFIYRFKIQQIY